MYDIIIIIVDQLFPDRLSNESCFSTAVQLYPSLLVVAADGLIVHFCIVFQFIVRYLDYGNSEEREARHLAPLRSEFKQLPFQALQCSIVCEDHTSFTQPVSIRTQK